MKKMRKKMLSDQIIEEYKERDKPLDSTFNFLIRKTDKLELDKVANEKDLSTSKLVRILIKEFLKDQKNLRKELNGDLK